MIEAIHAHLGTEMVNKQLFVNTGYVACVRKVINVNFCTFTTCPRCQSVSFIQNSMPAPIKSVHFYTLTQVPRRKNAPGTSEVSVGTDQIVDTSTQNVSYV